MSNGVSIPFAPPWEDLKQTVETRHAPCYLFDTCCKSLSPADKMRVDTAMVKAYQEAQRMQRLAAVQAETGGESAPTAG